MKKKVLLLWTILVVFACSNKNEIKEPQKPIKNEVMENILYDMALLQALKNHNLNKLKENKINPETYIYQKYKIDSIQLAENSKFFSNNIDDYKQMFQRVNDRLSKQKVELDTILARERRVKEKKTKDSIAKIKKESLAKVKKDSVTKIKKKDTVSKKPQTSKGKKV
jgi:hypothetical protein